MEGLTTSIQGGNFIKFSTKIPKFNEQSHSVLMKEGWKPLKEPKSLTNAALLSVPFMVINALLSIGIIYCYSSFSMQRFSFIKGNSIILTIDLGVVLAILLMVIIHELFHLIFIPNFLKSKDTIIGLTCFGAFVHTEQIITKARFLFISVAPFLFLSILFPLILAIFGLITGNILVFILFNALGASVDILGFFLVFIQVPKNAIIRSNGIRTYWKMVDE
ncbi:DUF3267 domain-containing protein [Neobacillus sp. MM2021_6]|uniref:DUF3267 domain-containing protein n=1 Tax=Bacillaceae TaxID=186817 RepID=UPI00140B2953|nr:MULTISPECIES: DUF3267 domain-containing protein [Bacillaceae]MBO0959792.1 DUF3267 domain-containing protein [Neobacillus sp. MM2021_6]NHC20094.1 DUF3267 domain-containing protein [Bacillus sp. MM2020_4]